MINPMSPQWGHVGVEYSTGRRESECARTTDGERSSLPVGRIVESYLVARERRERRDVMAAARAARLDAIDRERRESDPGYMSPLQSLAFDVEHELLPRATEVITRERKYRDALKAGEKGRHVNTVVEECTGSIIQLERLYADYVSERRMAAAVMAHDSGGGHSYSTPASTVNAESSAMRKSSRVRDSFDARPAKDRSAERPVSGVTELLDVERNARLGSGRIAGEPLKLKLDGTRLTARIPITVPADGSVRVSRDGGRSWRVESADSFNPADDVERRKSSTAVKPAEARSAALRAVVEAGTSSDFRHDFTTA